MKAIKRIGISLLVLAITAEPLPLENLFLLAPSTVLPQPLSKIRFPIRPWDAEHIFESIRDPKTTPRYKTDFTKENRILYFLADLPPLTEEAFRDLSAPFEDFLKAHLGSYFSAMAFDLVWQAAPTDLEKERLLRLLLDHYTQLHFSRNWVSTLSSILHRLEKVSISSELARILETHWMNDSLPHQQYSLNQFFVRRLDLLLPPDFNGDPRVIIQPSNGRSLWAQARRLAELRQREIPAAIPVEQPQESGWARASRVWGEHEIRLIEEIAARLKPCEKRKGLYLAFRKSKFLQRDFSKVRLLFRQGLPDAVAFRYATFPEFGKKQQILLETQGRKISVSLVNPVFQDRPPYLILAYVTPEGELIQEKVDLPDSHPKDQEEVVRWMRERVLELNGEVLTLNLPALARHLNLENRVLSYFYGGLLHLENPASIDQSL